MCYVLSLSGYYTYIAFDEEMLFIKSRNLVHHPFCIIDFDFDNSNSICSRKCSCESNCSSSLFSIQDEIVTLLNLTSIK